MAKKKFLVVATSYIGGRLITDDLPVAQRVVEIETDIKQGGMTPGDNLVECDDEGNPVTDKKAKGKKTGTDATTGEAGAGDMA